MSGKGFYSLSIRLTIISSLLWIIYVMRVVVGVSFNTVLWDYGLIFIFTGIVMIKVIKKYSNNIISDVQNSIRKEILRPFQLLPEDVDRAVDRGNSIYVECPDRDIFYTLSNITNSGSVVESVVTGDKFDYRGDIRKDLKGLITEGFHLYLKQAYDEMVSCGFTIDVQKKCS